MTLLERLRALPCVDEVSIEPDETGTSYFTYLRPGWEWSGQRGFGTENIREAYRLAKQAKQCCDPNMKRN